VNKKSISLLLTLLLVIVLATSNVLAYEFKQPVKLVIPFGAGGSHDIHGRFLSSVANKYLNGQPLLIELRPGGSGAVGATYVKNSKPDGHTLLFTQNGVHTILPLIEDVGYSYKDFETVAWINSGPVILVVRADHPADTYQEFVEWIHENEEKAVWGSTEILGISTAPAIRAHMALGSKDPFYRFLTYDGVGDCIRALLSGEIDFLWQIMSPTFVSLRSNKEVKILVVTDGERDPRIPDVPTLTECGYDITTSMWRGILAPKGTPTEVLDALENAFLNMTKDSSFIQLMNTAQEPIRFRGRKAFYDMWMQEQKDYRAILTELDLIRKDLDF